MAMLSIIIPTYNEEGNVKQLYEKIKGAVKQQHDILFIDDGSTDRTFEILSGLAVKDEHLKTIRFRRNFGQSAAMAAGFHAAKGDVIVTMDADLQNDPDDIGRLLAALKDYDVVCGWRRKRMDSIFSKKLPSRISNGIARKVTGLGIHDFGCTLRAYRGEVVRELELYGELHRYIPALAALQGYRIGELEVEHHHRKSGKTKYRPLRIFKGLSDLLNITFFSWFGDRPAHIFTSLGIISLGGGLAFLLLLAALRMLGTLQNLFHPMFFISLLAILMGTQLITTGLFSEMLIKLRYRLEDSRFYRVKETINL